MAKISELDLADPLAGDETMPIVQGGEMKQAPFADVLASVEAEGDVQIARVGAEGAVQVGLASTQRTLAEAAAGTALASTIVPLELSNHLLTRVERVAITRPALVTAEAFEIWGDSTPAGVGSETAATYSWPAQFGAMMTGGGSVTNNAAGGTTSAQTLTSVTAASATKKGRHFGISTGLNDLDILVGNRRDWASAGYTKGNIAAIKAQQTGGKQMGIVLALRPNYSAQGQKGSADFTFHYRDMIATYGADAINAARYMRWVSDRIGPDWYNAAQRHSRPLSKMGQATNVVPINNAPFIVSAGVPVDLNYDDGQYAWVTSLINWYRKVGGHGAGSWLLADGKHISRWGNQDIGTGIFADWAYAMLGLGAPFAPPQEFRCAFDIAAGALVGTVAIRTGTSAFGTVARAEIVSGNDDFVFDLGLDGRLRRSFRGTLKRQIYQLVIKVTGANGLSSLGIVDVFVGRASTQTLPQKLMIPAPVSLCGMEGHALSNTGKVFSGAAWINCSNFASQPYLYSWQTGANGSTARMFARFLWDSATSTGRFQLSVTGPTGSANILTATSRPQNFGSQGLPTNTWGWLTWAVNLATGTVIAFWNDSALSFASPGQLTFTDTVINLGDMSPGPFLNGRQLYGHDDQGSSPFLGGCGYLAIWDEYLDWTNAATRRQLFNADGTAAITNTTGTIDAKPSRMIAVQGEPVDLAWGGFNPGQLVEINRDALRTMTIA